MIENIGNFLPGFVRQNKLASLLGLAVGAIGCYLIGRWLVSKTPPSEETTKKSDDVGQNEIKKTAPTTSLPSTQENRQLEHSPKSKPQDLQLLEEKILTLKANNTPFQVKPEFLDQYDFLRLEPRPAHSEYVDYKTYLGGNRYPEIRPFNKNRFQFKDPNQYFNASRVLQGRAISCQGPLENEHDNFWRMVWESNTTAIIMLTDFMEDGKEKCSWYLPYENEKPSPEEVIVTQVEGPPRHIKSQEGVTALIERRLELEYEGEKRSVIHYHLSGWNDFQTVPETTLAELVLTVWEKHYSQGEHIISHCSAGIGRSGTFLATLEAYNKPVDPNLVIDIVRQLRSPEHGRMRMVQTKDQYGLIFKTLAVLDPNCATHFC